MQLQLVGYFPKNVILPDGWSFSEGVTEICSVSNCINSALDNWIDRWLHNDLGFFNTRFDARAILPPQARGYSLFAYRLLPLRFVKGHSESLTVDRFPVEPLSAAFTSLGFDVVSKSGSFCFECSPLSCNGIAAEVPVNCYCLVDALSEAIALGERFSLEEPEPGSYYVLEVLREQRAASDGLWPYLR